MLAFIIAYSIRNFIDWGAAAGTQNLALEPPHSVFIDMIMIFLRIIVVMNDCLDDSLIISLGMQSYGVNDSAMYLGQLFSAIIAGSLLVWVGTSGINAIMLSVALIFLCISFVPKWS